MFCICCSRHHKNIISSVHVAKCQPCWSFYASSLWGWNSTENWVNELAYGMKDNKSESVQNILRCLLSSETQTVWPTDCARALLSPELQRKCMKMSWCFDALAVKKHQMKAAIYPKRVVWCREAFQLHFQKGLYYFRCYLHIKHQVMIFKKLHYLIDIIKFIMMDFKYF